jgi:hypothetical protein
MYICDFWQADAIKHCIPLYNFAISPANLHKNIDISISVYSMIQPQFELKLLTGQVSFLQINAG